MKLPRDVSGQQIVRVLRHLGYEVVRQKGSHIRMRHNGPPTHYATVPNHDPVKAGTLHGILSEVSQAQTIALEKLIEML